LRRVVAVLSVTQIISWGVLYYAFAALSSSITADTSWSSVSVTGAFSLSQLVAAGAGIWVGRHIDGDGPRRVMTAGSLLAVPAVLVHSDRHRAWPRSTPGGCWPGSPWPGCCIRQRSRRSPTGPENAGWQR
jgi:MFS family permease